MQTKTKGTGCAVGRTREQRNCLLLLIKIILGHGADNLEEIEVFLQESRVAKTRFKGLKHDLHLAQEDRQEETVTRFPL